MTMVEFLQQVKEAGKIWGPSSSDFKVAFANYQQAKKAGWITYGKEHRPSTHPNAEIDAIIVKGLTPAGERELARLSK